MALATLDELIATIEWDLDAGEMRAASGALEELSDQATFYGKATWDQATVPRVVRRAILSAARRYMRNPDGYTTSRAGDETLGWTDRGHDSGSAYFTEREIKMIRAVAGHSPLSSAQATAWGPMNKHASGYVPVVNSAEKPFPMFSENDW